MPEDKDDSSRSAVGDEEVLVKKGEKEEQEDDEEEDSDGDFFDAGEGAVIDDRISSRAASKSGQSEGDTEDDPVGPMTPGLITTPTLSTSAKTTPSGKSHAVSFARTVSASTEGDLDDEEWVDPTPIPATPLDTTPPSKTLFQMNAGSVPAPPAMAKTKSSSSNSGKSRKSRKEARAPALLAPSVSVPFPSSSPPPSSQKQDGVIAGVTGADDDGSDPSRRIPQMSTARARDGGRTQSGGVKGVIAPLEQPGSERPEPEPEPEPEPGPELELVEADPDADDF